jgi:hypothetical protein
VKSASLAPRALTASAADSSTIGGISLARPRWGGIRILGEAPEAVIGRRADPDDLSGRAFIDAERADAGAERAGLAACRVPRTAGGWPRAAGRDRCRGRRAADGGPGPVPLTAGRVPLY